VDFGQFVIVVYRLLNQYVTVVPSVYYDVPGNLVTLVTFGNFGNFGNLKIKLNFSKVGVGAKLRRQLLGQFFYPQKNKKTKSM